MARFVDVDDLQVLQPNLESSVAEELIRDAEAEAILAAPCLADSSDLESWQEDAVRGILRTAILRHHGAGTTGSTQLSAGPFSQTVSEPAAKALFFRAEIRKLRKVCGSGRAFAINQLRKEDEDRPLLPDWYESESD